MTLWLQNDLKITFEWLLNDFDMGGGARRRAVPLGPRPLGSPGSQARAPPRASTHAEAIQKSFKSHF